MLCRPGQSICAVDLYSVGLLDVLLNFLCCDCWVDVVYEYVRVGFACGFFGFSDCGVVEVVVEGCCCEFVCVLFVVEGDDVSAVVFCSGDVLNVVVIFVACE